jgi:hypothetical protein
MRVEIDQFALDHECKCDADNFPSFGPVEAPTRDMDKYSYWRIFYSDGTA